MTSPIVTRIELYYAVEQAFAAAPVQRTDLIDVARARGVRAEVIDALANLPDDIRFAHMRDLWPHYPGMPTGQ